jgi:predicted nicotinamide N-methyase
VRRDETKIAGYPATLTAVTVGADAIALWRVADLERHVDRRALLAADDPPEPPYWAHCWSGAAVLADAIPARAGRVVEVGCGLGLPGLVAARRGARVTFVDRAAPALAFVRASAAANGLGRVDACVADVLTGAVAGRFDLVLAAELVYERAAFALLASALAALVAPGGRILLTDARRIDTGPFYAGLPALGLAWTARDVVVREDGFAVPVRLVDLRPQSALAATPAWGGRRT